MHRRPILERLRRYHPLDQNEKAAWKATVAFIESCPDCFERISAPGHVTASGWVVDPSAGKVLLTRHRKLGRWLQCGGHADGEADVLKVALREVREESGLQDLRPISPEIFDVDVHSIPAQGDTPAHLHYDIRFALQVCGSMALEPNHESLELAWVEIKELPQLTNEESIMRMQRKWLFEQGPLP